MSWDTAEERYVGRFNGKRAVFVTASAKDRVNVFDVRDGIYQKLHDRAVSSRAAVLEWIIILLIAFEIVLTFVR